MYVCEREFMVCMFCVVLRRSCRSKARRSDLDICCVVMCEYVCEREFMVAKARRSDGNLMCCDVSVCV